jgi:hypothetical protein
MLNTNHYIRSYVPLTLVGSSPSSLGIGNRIYQDSRENSSLQSDILHNSTITQIHEGKFNSYYLLDAYKTYCSFRNERVDKIKLIFGTIGTISEILAKGRVRDYLPEVVTVFGKKTVYISFVPLVCVGFVLNVARFGLTRWVRLFRWVNLRFDPKAWNIQIDEQFGLNSIEDALRLVAEETIKRQTR